MTLDFEQLYNSYFMEVYSFTLTIVRNSHIAEEITQDVFFKALKNHDKYRGEANEYTWLCAIAKNACMDYMKKQNRTTELDGEYSSEMNIEKLLVNEDLSLQIHQILHSLEEPYKEVFQLRIFGELSFDKIGKIFSKTENWARVTFHRAKLKIQERMKTNE